MSREFGNRPDVASGQVDALVIARCRMPCGRTGFDNPALVPRSRMMRRIISPESLAVPFARAGPPPRSRRTNTAARIAAPDLEPIPQDCGGRGWQGKSFPILPALAVDPQGRRGSVLGPLDVDQVEAGCLRPAQSHVVQDPKQRQVPPLPPPPVVRLCSGNPRACCGTRPRRDRSYPGRVRQSGPRPRATRNKPRSTGQPWTWTAESRCAGRWLPRTVAVPPAPPGRPGPHDSLLRGSSRIANRRPPAGSDDRTRPRNPAGPIHRRDGLWISVPPGMPRSGPGGGYLESPLAGYV